MWTKINCGKSLVGQPQVVQLEEEPLRPLVELGIAGHRLVIPGPHSAHGTHLATHVGDVGQRPLVRVRAHLDRRVLGGQTERVEADGEEDVVALHAAIAGRGVAGRHRVPVADVQVARRVGQHRQEVELLAARVFDRRVQAVRFPLLLPARLDLLWIVLFGHMSSLLFVLVLVLLLVLALDTPRDRRVRGRVGVRVRKIENAHVRSGTKAHAPRYHPV